jgi:hypothetical protein
MRRMSEYQASVVVVVLLWMASCTAPPAGSPRSVSAADLVSRAAILDELDRYYSDFSARRWSAYASHFWPGATITTAFQPQGESAERVVVMPIAEFVAKAPQGPGSQPIFEERMTQADVRVEGDLAQAWTRYTVKFGRPEKLSEWTGADAFTLMRFDGKWRIVSLVFAGDE